LARSLSVNPGDVVKLEAYTKYVDPNTANWTAALNTLMGQIATATAGVVVDGAGYVTSTSSFPYAGLVTPTGNSGVPKACINWILFDRNFSSPPQVGFVCMAGTAKENGSNVAHEKLAPPDITITDPGYMYIYLSNESTTPVDVYFDDFKVTQVHSNVVAGADYYPFGLVMDTREITLEPYRYGYQGQFAEKDNDTQFNIFDLRMYDARIGRWISPDPYGQFASPYVGMGNNPVSGTDPDGGFCPECVTIEGGTFEAVEISAPRIGSISGLERIPMTPITFANNGAYYQDANKTWNFVDPNNRKFYEYTKDGWQLYRDEGKMEELTAKGLANFSEKSQQAVYNATIFVAEGEIIGAGVQVTLKIGGRIFAGIASKVAAKAGAQIGTKLEYVFGKATGSSHNIERSTEMLRQLQSVGIFDNAAGRSLLKSHLKSAYSGAKAVLQPNGRYLRESLLMGPNGGLKVESIWEGSQLITVKLFGGR
jgi:RHS repeat-associated protein